MLHLAEGATILPRHPDRVLAFFDKACLIEHQDTVWLAHRLRHELMVVPQHVLVIPGDITDEPLQSTHRAPLNVEGHRLDRFTFEGAALADQIVKEMGARLTAAKVKRGDGKTVTCGSTGW